MKQQQIMYRNVIKRAITGKIISANSSETQ